MFGNHKYALIIFAQFGHGRRDIGDSPYFLLQLRRNTFLYQFGAKMDINRPPRNILIKCIGNCLRRILAGCLQNAVQFIANILHICLHHPRFIPHYAGTDFRFPLNLFLRLLLGKIRCIVGNGA